ncbi:MAG TPA: META domain-containing protein [Acidimicrobiia bacterium]|nr:META domain-containing protein [Acidimicrobiia bacterium]
MAGGLHLGRTGRSARPALGRVRDGDDGGSGGVNRFSGSYQLDDAVIEIGMLVSTLMAGPPELMVLEQRFGIHLPRRTP